MKISFCTACMDRLTHLKETYRENMSRAGHDDVEFVLVDYGGSDSLGEWVSENLSGVKFIRIPTRRYWVASHAKNIAHKAATGDVLCNLDCDVIIPDGFAKYVREVMSSERHMIMAGERDVLGNYGCSGLVASKREHFFSVNGYDESMNLGWGFESSNFVFRVCRKNSLEAVVVTGAACIPHSDEIRTARCQLKDMNFTATVSSRISDEMAESKDYVANKHSEWGQVSCNPLA